MSTHNGEDDKAASRDNGPSRVPGTPVAGFLSRVPRTRDTGAEPASSSSGPDRGGLDNAAAGAMQTEASSDVGTSQDVPGRRNKKRTRAVAKPSLAPHLILPVDDRTATGEHEDEDDANFGFDDAFCLEPPEPLSFGNETAALVMTEQGELKPRRVSTACAKLLVRSGLRCAFCFRHRSACIC